MTAIATRTPAFTRSHGTTPSLFVRLAAAWRARAARRVEARRMRDDMERLMVLDDRLLADMGIDRHDIETRLGGRYY